MAPNRVAALLILGLIVVSDQKLSAQPAAPSNPWQYIGHNTADATASLRSTTQVTRGPRPIVGKLRAYGRFAASEALLRTTLESTPAEFTLAAPLILPIPLPDGTFERVEVEESPIFSPALQAQYDAIRTYVVRGVDNSTLTGRLDYTPAGFHGMLISDRGVLFVDPAGDGTNEYVSYWKTDAVGDAFFCEVHGNELFPRRDASLGDLRPHLVAAPSAMNPSGGELRTYRLAISTTGEYTRFFDGTPPTIGTPNTVAQIATTINRVTGVFEREVQIRLNLTATRIFDDPATDPFAMFFLDQNQATLDADPGAENYDIGHVFSRGGSGGSGWLGSVCVTGSKAKGVTNRITPSGDPFDIDYVAHEIGHQFGAHHTFTGNAGSCGNASWAAAAYEPGSGSTIMAYAGICAEQNVQRNSDAYFHTHSYDEIVAFRTSGAGSTCGTAMDTGNHPPTVDAGPHCTVPHSTPFTLTAKGSDPDGGSLTYLWEQFDLGTRGQVPAPDNTTGPLFRSWPASPSASRTFPRFEDILSGLPTPWEVLSNVDRTLTFRVTARDGHTGGGGVDYDTTQVTASGDPFALAFPAVGSTLQCGGPETVQWTVGGGSIAPHVAVELSTDDGLSFSSFVSRTPNDGAQTITTPRLLTSQGRIKLVPSAQCFFAASPKFSIVDTLNPAIAAPADLVRECTSRTGTSVFLGTPSAVDQCDSSLSVGNDAPSVFPLGTTAVRWTAHDDSSNAGTDSQLVTIRDTTAPIIAGASATPNKLWPPNHKMVPVSLAVSMSDVCDASAACRVLSVTSNEPVNGGGDGNTSPDWAITGPLSVMLRAERAGNRSGRVYTIIVGCTDATGNRSTKPVTVTVAHHGS